MRDEGKVKHLRRYPKKGGQFAIIWVDLLYEDSVPASAKLLFGEIYRLSDADGWCDASNKDFMDLLGCSETTVRNLLKALADVGQIHIETEPNREGVGGVKRRIFCARKLAPLPSGGVPAENCGNRKNLRGVPAENCGSTYLKSNKKNIPPVVPQGDGEANLFDRFWEAYPRKKGKEAARRAWDKLAPDLALCRVMSAALAEQKKSKDWTKDGGQYIPYPATWLNGKRWQDELEPAAPEPDTEGGYVDGL